MKVGYARVSTLDKGQSTDPQEMRLREDGCKIIFTDTGQSGAKASRPGWDECLAFLAPGDVLVTVRLDRFGRSVQHLLKVADDLRERGIGLRCLDQPVDTETAMGRMVFTILAAVAEFELAILKERTADGMASAREQGKQIGGTPALNAAQAAQVVKMRGLGMKPQEIADMMSVDKRTIYRTLQRAQEAPAA